MVKKEKWAIYLLLVILCLEECWYNNDLYWNRCDVINVTSKLGHTEGVGGGGGGRGGGGGELKAELWNSNE